MVCRELGTSLAEYSFGSVKPSKSRRPAVSRSRRVRDLPDALPPDRGDDPAAARYSASLLKPNVLNARPRSWVIERFGGLGRRAALWGGRCRAKARHYFRHYFQFRILAHGSPQIASVAHDEQRSNSAEGVREAVYRREPLVEL